MNSHLDLYSSPVPQGSASLSHGHDQLSEDQSHSHLSDSQIDDQLIGDLAAEPAAHLASCPVCIGRVAAAASPLDSFQSVTMAWSERRSATLPIPDFTQHQPFWQRHMAWATVCFVFAIGIALTNAGHQVVTRMAELQPMQQDSTQAPTQQTAPSSAVLTETASATGAPQEAQTFADNQMLKAIDDDLDTSADNPATLGIEPVNVRSRRSSTTLSLQD
jgi:hypothetical protein